MTNPFRARQLARQRRSGKHRSPGVITDRLLMADELAVSFARDTAQLHDQPFPQSPF